MSSLSGWSIVAVGSGAAVGAWIRWVLGMLLNPVFPTMPLGTLAANIVGGFLMGISMAVFARFEALPPEIRLLVTTGFLGGLTTFSTFSAETVTLVSGGQHGWAAGIILIHVTGSVAATFAGLILASALFPGGLQ